MEKLEKQLNILELLVQHEREVSELYKVYAENIPGMKDFWEIISGEENIHARWILNIKPRIETSIIYLDTEKFTPESITESSRFIKEAKAKVINGEHDKTKALYTALDVEKALIEGKTLELFKTDSAELKHFLDFLIEETKRHIEIISERIAHENEEKKHEG